MKGKNTDQRFAELDKSIANLEKQPANGSRAVGARVEEIKIALGDTISMVIRKSDGTIACRVSPLT